MPVGANRLASGATAIAAAPSFTRPAGTLDTDIVMFGVVIRSSSAVTITKPAGLTAAPQVVGASQVTMQAFYGVAGTATSWAFSSPNANVEWCFIGIYPDAEVTSPQFTGVNSSGLTTSITPSLTGADGGVYIAMAGQNVAAGTITAPAAPYKTMATVGNGKSGTSAQTGTFGQEYLTAAGATGTRTITWAATSNTGASSLLISAATVASAAPFRRMGKRRF